MICYNYKKPLGGRFHLKKSFFSFRKAILLLLLIIVVSCLLTLGAIIFFIGKKNFHSNYFYLPITINGITSATLTLAILVVQSLNNKQTNERLTATLTAEYLSKVNAIFNNILDLSILLNITNEKYLDFLSKKKLPHHITEIDMNMKKDEYTYLIDHYAFDYQYILYDEVASVPYLLQSFFTKETFSDILSNKKANSNKDFAFQVGSIISRLVWKYCGDLEVVSILIDNGKVQREVILSEISDTLKTFIHRSTIIIGGQDKMIMRYPTLFKLFKEINGI